MKPRFSHLVLAGLLVGAAVWVALTFFGGDAGRIRARLDELGERLEKEQGESNLVGAAKMGRLGDFFTPQFEIAVTPYGQSVSRVQDLQRVAMGYRMRAAAIEVDLRVEDLEIDAAARGAQLTAVATVTGVDQDTVRRESYRIAFEWQKLDGDWLIRRVEVLEILEGLPLF